LGLSIGFLWAGGKGLRFEVWIDAKKGNSTDTGKFLDCKLQHEFHTTSLFVVVNARYSKVAH
jgi:hypothetical protein